VELLTTYLLGGHGSVYMIVEVELITQENLIHFKEQESDYE